MLQWLRKIKSKKSFRIFTIIGIAVLSMGLIGSYAIWSAPNISSSKAEDDAPLDPSVQYQEAETKIAELEKSKAENKDDPEILEKLGNAYYDLGFQMFMDGGDSDTVFSKLSSALENYEAALKLDPENVPLMLQAASTATGVQNFERAEALYKKALEVEPDSASNKMAYGNFLLYVKSDFEGAKKQFQEGLKLNPDEQTKTSLEGLLDQVDQLEKQAKEATDKADKSKGQGETGNKGTQEKGTNDATKDATKDGTKDATE